MDTTAASPALLGGGGAGFERLQELRPELVAAAGNTYRDLGAFLDPATLDLIRVEAATVLGVPEQRDVRDTAPAADALTDEQVAALEHWRDVPDLSERQRACLALVEQFCHSAQGVTDQHYADLTPHFSPEQLFAMTFTISLVERYLRLTNFVGALEGSAR